MLASSCYFISDRTPSVLIIAVDNLGVNQLTCPSDSVTDADAHLRSGIFSMCQESIRFTHAYTTSTLSGPALASILTGQYPFQHKLRNNGKSFLSSGFKTLAETAHLKNYATAFFSGGAPVLRKLNLHQGFDIFDDSWTPAPKYLFKPFSETQASFETWLEDLGNQSFFSVIYVPDLIHTRLPTQNELGESRNLSLESQIEEFDESLHSLIQSLKARRWWDSTLVVLVGLNGPQLEHHPQVLQNANLFSERTHVGLLVKPAQKPRDQGMNWSFDDNVTIADIGETLSRILSGQTPPSLTDDDLSVDDLSPIFVNSTPDIPDRPIIIESSWEEMKSPRYAFRWGQYLFLLDEEPKVYNSLIDKFENAPLQVSDPSVSPLWEEIQKISRRHKLKPWSGIPKEDVTKWKGLSEIWSNFQNAPSNLSPFGLFANRLENDPEVLQSYNRELLRQGRWTDLKKWSYGIGFTDLEGIADRNLGQGHQIAFRDPCLKTLEMSNPTARDLKQCSNPTAFSLIEWVLSERRDLSESTRENARKKFLRRYLIQELDQRIVQENWALEGVWDISMTLRTRPPIVEMMLALPEMKRYRQAAIKAAQQAKLTPPST